MLWQDFLISTEWLFVWLLWINLWTICWSSSWTEDHIWHLSSIYLSVFVWCKLMLLHFKSCFFLSVRTLAIVLRPGAVWCYEHKSLGVTVTRVIFISLCDQHVAAEDVCAILLNITPWYSMFLFWRRTNVVMNYSEVESKVREATNDEPWGPSGQLMSEISK